MKTVPKGEIALEILDADGKSVRRYSSTKQVRLDQPPEPDAERPHRELEPVAGLNRFQWDLHYEPVPQVPGYSLFLYSRGESGPLALPGKYTVKLTAGGKDYTAPLEVTLDPRVKVGMDDLKKQFDLLTRIHRDLANLYSTVNQMQDVRGQLKGLQSRLPENAVTKAALDLDKKIQAAENVLIEFRITSSEDSLAYPLALDGKLSVLATTVAGAVDSAADRGGE